MDADLDDLLNAVQPPAARLPLTHEDFVIRARASDPVEPPAVLESWSMQSWELEVEDSAVPAPAYNLTKIRYFHHEIARRLAVGERPFQISEILGCSPATIGLLQRSPAMLQLIDYYTQNRNASAIDYGRKMDGVLGDGLSLVHDRVLTESIDNKDLIRLVSTLASRRGFPEVTRGESKQINLSLTAEEIQEIKEQASWPATRSTLPPTAPTVLEATEVQPIPTDTGSATS